jgi:cardiolipin synthase
MRPTVNQLFSNMGITFETFFIGLIILCYFFAVLSIFHAVMRPRTAQGTIAWVISLLTLPYLALPLYWLFGRYKFQGYLKALQGSPSKDFEDVLRQVKEHNQPRYHAHLDEKLGNLHTLGKLVKMPFTKGNGVQLLVDGEPIMASIFEAIEAAQSYILFQFFIIKDDVLGREVKTRLIQKAENNVSVFFLYDDVGSHALPNSYLQDLEAAGIQVTGFKTAQGHTNRFQVNFRNHRKVIVVDGKTAFVGGLNIGDEYMGKHSRLSPWRDTHLRLEGPCVQSVQFSFLEDWYWATKMVPLLQWEPSPSASEDKDVLVLATGPADEFETGSLFFSQAIHSAQERIWITSPYFVPDLAVMGALQLAAIRGVDVRILLPKSFDQLLTHLSSYAFVDLARRAGVRFYRYEAGFLHEKVMLIDDQISCVGTANFDNRSFRLNFEISILVVGRQFARSVEEMLKADLALSTEDTESLSERSFFFRLAVQLARLFSPIQ